MSGKMSATQVAPDPSSFSDMSGSAPKILDYYAWSQEQAAHIRAGRFDQLDILNVADEIEDVGRSEKRELKSNLENVLVQILKWDHQPQRRSRSWMLSIAEHRARVLQNLADNPSFTGYFAAAIDSAYSVARLRAARETKIVLKRFPKECPYDREMIMEAVYEIDES